MKPTRLNEVGIAETMSDSAYLLGIDENQDIVRVPKSTIGKVKTINGQEVDESGNINVCKALAKVGEQFNVEGEILSVEFVTKSCVMKENYFEITEEGMPCIVWFDGKRYDCISAKSEEDGYVSYFIGNRALSNTPGLDTGENFYYSFKVYENSEENYGVVRSERADDHRFEIAKASISVTRIPDKFLPTVILDYANFIQFDKHRFIIYDDCCDGYSTSELWDMIQSGIQVKIKRELADGTIVYYEPSGYKRYTESATGLNHEDTMLVFSTIYTPAIIDGWSFSVGESTIIYLFVTSFGASETPCAFYNE